VLGLIVLLLSAIGSGIAALSILGHPGWLWQILATFAVINALAAFAVALRQTWGRRLVFILLGAQIVFVVSVLVVAAAVMIRDTAYFSGAITLSVFVFVPIAAAVIAISLLAAWSINRLEWPNR
jgi:ABC-type glycerol-3-phosphate transport system permease component